MEDLISFLKNVGAVLATIVALTYATGYLALRARAYFLGTDPAYSLIDEGYIFAGFRFFLISSIMILLISPVFILLRYFIQTYYFKIPEGISQTLQWVAVFILVIVSLWLLRILNINSLLINQPDKLSIIQKAILGDQPLVRLAYSFITVSLTVSTCIWLFTICQKGDAITLVWILSVLMFIQICIMIIYHGAFFADHRVRLLAYSPSTIKNELFEVGIVDRSSNHAAIIGKNKSNESLLFTVDIEDIEGIPVKGIVKLYEFIKQSPNIELDSSIKTEPVIEGNDQHDITDTDNIDHSSQSSGITIRSFLESITSKLNMTFENIGSLSNDKGISGQLWLASISSSNVPESYRIGSFSDLSWPVLSHDNSTIYAIQDKSILIISTSGEILKTFNPVSEWIKLLGVLEDNSVLGLIRESDEMKPALLTNDGEQYIIDYELSKDVKEKIYILVNENRVYSDNKNLRVERSERGQRGFDIYLVEKDKAYVNISDCGDDNCRQPSLSQDGTYIVYIRKPLQ